MSLPHHTSLAAGRWATLSILEQLANVGSEVDRAIKARARGQQERWEHATARALELFDLTATDPRWTALRRREILRAREVFCQLFFASDGSADSAARQQAYFMQFAVAARSASAR